MYRAVKLAMLKERNLSLADLVDALRKQGYTPHVGTVSSLRSDTRDTLRVIQDAGLADFQLT